MEAHRQNAERYSDQHRKEQRHSDQPQMLLGTARHLVQPSLRFRRRRSEKLRGNFAEADFLNIGLRIHIEHGLFTDLALETLERLPLLRMLVHESLPRHPYRLIHGEEVV